MNLLDSMFLLGAEISAEVWWLKADCNDGNDGEDNNSHDPTVLHNVTKLRLLLSFWLRDTQWQKMTYCLRNKCCQWWWVWRSSSSLINKSSNSLQWNLKQPHELFFIQESFCSIQCGFFLVTFRQIKLFSEAGWKVKINLTIGRKQNTNHEVTHFVQPTSHNLLSGPRGRFPNLQ